MSTPNLARAVWGLIGVACCAMLNGCADDPMTFRFVPAYPIGHVSPDIAAAAERLAARQAATGFSLTPVALQEVKGGIQLYLLLRDDPKSCPSASSFADDLTYYDPAGLVEIRLADGSAHPLRALKRPHFSGYTCVLLAPMTHQELAGHPGFLVVGAAINCDPLPEGQKLTFAFTPGANAYLQHRGQCPGCLVTLDPVRLVFTSGAVDVLWVAEDAL